MDKIVKKKVKHTDMAEFKGKIKVLSMLAGGLFSAACGHNHNTKSQVISSAYVSLQGATGEHKITVEVADTMTSRARGLMHRKELGSDKGMLFIFPSTALRSFWMKNTHIPLDMLFIDESQTIVGIVENAEPETLTPRKVDTPSRYVLEVNGGFCAEHKILPGSQVEFHLQH